MRPSRREKKDGPFEPRGGSVSSVLAGARASLLNPSRPYTPADHNRPLFSGSDYNSRPTSAYHPAELLQNVVGAAKSSSQTLDVDSWRCTDDALHGGDGEEARPSSSYGQREPGGRGRTRKEGERIHLPGAQQSDREMGRHPDASGAATAALVGEFDLPGADLLQLCEDLWHHVTSAEFRDARAAGLPVDKIVTGRLSNLAQERSEDARLMLAVARVLLQAITRRGSELLSTCRMVFKISKTENNDVAFFESHIIEPLISLVIHEAGDMGSEIPPATTAKARRTVTPFDILVYAIGTLKNVSQQSQRNQKQMGQQGIFAAMAEVLSFAVDDEPGTRVSNSATIERQPRRYSERQAQVLVQATATLRNLAVLSAHRKQFVAFDIVEKLCRLMSSAGALDHLELMLNISRILSKLTLHEDCRTPMYQQSAIRSCVRLLETYPANLSLVLRTCFILGNLTTTSDECRVLILEIPGAIELALDMLERLCDRSFEDESASAPRPGPEPEPEPESEVEPEPESEPVDSAARHSQVDETLVKLIRLVANLAINGEIGLMISQDRRCMLLVSVLERKPITLHEELVLNAVSAITNLSFYHQPLNAVLQHETVAALLVPLLLHDNHEAKLECARCFGNLSRFPEIRRVMKTRRVDEILVILLDHPRKEVLLAVCGVLMNLAADNIFRSVLRDLHAVQKMMTVLEQLSLELTDLPLASMLCKTFFNCGLGNDEEAVMTTGEADMLVDMINMLLEQCAEAEFSREVEAEGGESGTETLRVCMAVARALSEQLDARLQTAGSSVCAPSNSHACADLEPLPPPPNDLQQLPSLPTTIDGELASEATEDASAARAQRLASLIN